MAGIHGRFGRLVAPVVAVAGVIAAVALAPPAATAQTQDVHAALLQAQWHGAAARRHERLARRERARARRVLRRARQLRRSTGEGRTPGPAVRRARRHRARAARHRRKARWHRAQRRRLLLHAQAAAGSSLPAAPPRPPPRRAPIPLGTAVTWEEFSSDASLRSLFLDRFQQMTAENEMKMFALQPAPGEFRFEVADEMVDWARANRKRVRGHTLVYGNQLPAWVANQQWTREELIEVMRRHIHAVVGHFRGRVAEWDVVNEAIEGDGSYKQNLWYRVIGGDYVEQAFRFAREADPAATLFYNDNGIDLPDHAHTRGVRTMLWDLRRRGVPVGGVGMQNHVSNRWHASSEQVAQAMDLFGDLGLKVAVTEMDVRTDGGRAASEELRSQANVFGGYARACRQDPRCTGFATWGISDRYSWITTPGMRPLLFDSDLRPKPALPPVEDWIRGP